MSAPRFTSGERRGALAVGLIMLIAALAIIFAKGLVAHDPPRVVKVVQQDTVQTKSAKKSSSSSPSTSHKRKRLSNKNKRTVRQSEGRSRNPLDEPADK